ncbi:putative NTP binding protein [Cladophialophora carrionii]|uniref:Putative NTP binding protein n=1 Tax=Cladophialophora carrionii TaxID=86049 RepID=A0A1C1CQA6_9EURO|nr:putative NTP binding protein [Cladophialophora carrionii]
MGLENGKSEHGNAEPRSNAEDQDADAILASLEEEDDTSYRAQRMQEYNSAATTTVFNTAKQAYVTLKSDDEALSFTTEHERAVVHFFHPDFARCSTMDSHCEIIALKHAEYADGDVAFARINVNHAPFVVEKLGVRVLPCVIGFVKGVVKGRITGFEGLCWDGKEGSVEVTRALEEAIVDWTVVRKRLLLRHDDDDDESGEDDNAPDRRKTGRRGIRDRKQTVGDEDDDWD